MAIDLMALTPHKVSSDLSGYITYVFGAPKTGKTTLASQAPDCLLLACERGYNAIPGIIAQDITSWAEMRQVFKELKKPEVQARFKTVIVDTIDLAAKYCTKYICNQNEVQELGDLPYGKGYNLMRSEFEDIFNSLAQLGYAIIFISHAQESVFTRENGTEYNRIIPSLSPSKVNAIIENMADIYGYAHQKIYEDGSSQVVLTLRSNDGSISCGSRFKYIDSEVPFTYDALVDAINRAIATESSGANKQFYTEEKNVFSSNELNFDELMAQFNDMVDKIQKNSGPDFGKKWAPKIVAITDKYLGKGKKVNDMTPTQVEQLDLIVSDLLDLVSNGL